MTTPLFFTNGRIFDGTTFHENCCLRVDGATITEIAAVKDVSKAGRIIDLAGKLLAPGYIDLQVNGGGGILFNDSPSVSAIADIIAAHRRHGTTSLLITFITDDLQTTRMAAKAVAAALQQGIPGLLGVHFEGPVLNSERHGAHAQALFRNYSPEIQRILEICRAGEILFTLAPERVTDDDIRVLTSGGVHVFCGHSMATPERLSGAMKAGLKGFTHLFNAMPPLQGRSPGPVGAALLADDAWCGIIADGHHVHWQALSLALRCKPPGKLFLVTDAMPPAGAAHAERYRLSGEEVTVTDGCCRTQDGTLAGSALTMDVAVRNIINHLDCPVDEALRMASTYPAACLGLDNRLGALKPGYQADFVILDSAFAVTETWIAGQTPAPVS